MPASNGMCDSPGRLGLNASFVFQDGRGERSSAFIADANPIGGFTTANIKPVAARRKPGLAAEAVARAGIRRRRPASTTNASRPESV